MNLTKSVPADIDREVFGNLNNDLETFKTYYLTSFLKEEENNNYNKSIFSTR